MTDTNFDFHFYRCRSCHSILTRDDETKAKKTGIACKCGGFRYSPTNPTDLEWDLPKVQSYCATNDLQRPADEA